MPKSVRDVIRRAAKGSSWSHFMDYASPALFEVMPLRALLAQGKEFVSNGSDARRYAKVHENIASSLNARGLEVELRPQENGAAGLVPLDLYAGFYLDDEPRFEAGLRQLGLQDSGDALMSHLGSGDHSTSSLMCAARSIGLAGAASSR